MKRFKQPRNFHAINAFQRHAGAMQDKRNDLDERAWDKEWQQEPDEMITCHCCHQLKPFSDLENNGGICTACYNEFC